MYVLLAARLAPSTRLVLVLTPGLLGPLPRRVIIPSPGMRSRVRRSGVVANRESRCPRDSGGAYGQVVHHVDLRRALPAHAQVFASGSVPPTWFRRIPAHPSLGCVQRLTLFNSQLPLTGAHVGPRCPSCRSGCYGERLRAFPPGPFRSVFHTTTLVKRRLTLASCSALPGEPGRFTAEPLLGITCAVRRSHAFPHTRRRPR